MLSVGLTGGIASGKSHVTAILTELGCSCIDADQVARLVVEPGQPAFDEIKAEFGSEIILPDGKIDRAKLGSIVFADETKRLRLNAIVHPRVHEYQNQWLESVAAREPRSIAVVDAALMIESGGYRKFDKIVVVFCSRETQLERLINRNGLTREQAEMRIASQMPTEDKLRFADFTVDTSGSFDETREKVEDLFIQLKQAEELSAKKLL